MSRVAFYDSPAFDAHDAGPGHPERPERLDALRRGLREAGLAGDLARGAPRPATTDELLRVHTPELVAQIASTRGRRVRLDEDTVAGPRSHEAALLAAGAAVDAVERVLAGEFSRAFCAVRPPGHHATADRPMGFCLFNSVAVAAAAALAQGIERVAVVDFDVHHGNGTQEIFWNEPRVLFVSSHQFPLYPGSGSLSETGGDRAPGLTVNLPLRAGSGDAEYARVYREIVEPIGRAFAPGLVLVSAGFDAHRGDPLAGMDMTGAGYAAVMDVCVAMAEESAAGRVVAVLEGGYALDGVASAAAATVGRLLDRAPAARLEGDGARVDGVIEACRAAYAPAWPVLGRSDRH